MHDSSYSVAQAKREVAAVGITCLSGWAFCYLAIETFGDYAWGLFVWLPFVMGAASTLIYGFNRNTKRKVLRNISFVSLAVFCLGLLVFAWEGLICLLMVLPLGFLFNWLGHRAGYWVIKHKMNTSTLPVVLLFSVPTLMAFENERNDTEEWRSVITTIEINASADKVWNNVIAFPRLKQPAEFIFKTGIAYPVSATISGQGVGAVRRCHFSTGSFVEPITVWNKPRLLQFSVEQQPEPMKELSFYNIQPNHLHGYWVSKKGQFKLTPLTNGHTLLQGTTWYVNKIKPHFYWTLWSDYIVHQIHKRVLMHIKAEAER